MNMVALLSSLKRALMASIWFAKRLFPLFFAASLINVFHNTMYSAGSWPPKLFLASISFLAGSVFWDVIISAKMSWSANTVRTTTICFFSHQDILLVTDFPYFFPRVLLEPIQRKLASHPCYQLVIKEVFQFSKSKAVFEKMGLFFFQLCRQCFIYESASP